MDDIQRILAENRAELSAQEEEVIRARFMLGPNLPGSQPQTLEQVGRVIGVTKERVRQIQNKALQKLRTALEDGLTRSPVLPGDNQP